MEMNSRLSTSPSKELHNHLLRTRATATAVKIVYSMSFTHHLRDLKRLVFQQPHQTEENNSIKELSDSIVMIFRAAQSTNTNITISNSTIRSQKVNN